MKAASSTSASASGSKVASSGAGASSGSKVVKKVEMKEAKTDSSFFSAPKPKKILPSFKKVPPPPATTAREDVKMEAAQPSNENPFELALKEMSGKKASVARKSDAAGATGNIKVESRSGTETPPAAAGRPGKRRKVTWAPEGELEKVKIIEPAVYEDDEGAASGFGEVRFFFHDIYRCEDFADWRCRPIV